MPGFDRTGPQGAGPVRCDASILPMKRSDFRAEMHKMRAQNLRPALGPSRP